MLQLQQELLKLLPCWQALWKMARQPWWALQSSAWALQELASLVLAGLLVELRSSPPVQNVFHVSHN